MLCTFMFKVILEIIEENNSSSLRNKLGKLDLIRKEILANGENNLEIKDCAVCVESKFDF